MEIQLGELKNSQCEHAYPIRINVFEYKGNANFFDRLTHKWCIVKSKIILLLLSTTKSWLTKVELKQYWSHFKTVQKPYWRFHDGFNPLIREDCLGDQVNLLEKKRKCKKKEILRENNHRKNNLHPLITGLIIQAILIWTAI